MPTAITPTILIVNDDENFPHGITRELRREPYRILYAWSGDAALDMLCVETVDVMVIGEQLPDISGTDLVTIVRFQFPTVMSIMVSAQTSKLTVIEALNK
jgi:DNA-binding response OmpR family regulator